MTEMCSRLRSVWRSFIVMLGMTAVGLIALGAMTPAVAGGDVPTMPLKFHAELAIQKTNPPTYSIFLEWLAPAEGGPVMKYRIYQSIVTANGAVTFEAIGKTTETRFSIENVKGGVYAYYVTALNEAGEGAPTQHEYVRVPGSDDPVKPVIKFVTYPNGTAVIGATYEYDAEAVTENGQAVMYEITDSPLASPIPGAEGMTVDPVTGVVTWTPAGTGVFSAAIRAYLKDDPAIGETQLWTINVETAPCALLYGTVMDSDGAEVVEGQVMAMQVDTEPGKDPNGKGRPYYGRVKGGKFEMNVPEGKYAVRIDAAAVIGEWYEDTQELATARRIDAACGDKIELNFTLEALPKPKQFAITGVVTDKATGKGLKAGIEFYSPVRNVPVGPNGGIVKEAFYVKTDEEGRYKIELTEGMEYIARAMAADPSYMPQYFDHVASEIEATPIGMNHASGSVDFALEGRPVYQNSLTGSVIDSAGNPVQAKVLAMRMVTTKPNTLPEKNFVAGAATDSLGNYSITNLEPGEYVLHAVPLEKNFVPGYYRAGDMASLSWEEATIVSVSDVTVALQYDIRLRARTGAKGNSKLNGVVNFKPGSTRKNGSVSQGMDILAGVFVYALDSRNQVGDYTYSDGNGYFEMSELAEGQYTVVADKIGFEKLAVTLSFDNDEYQNVEKDLTLNAPSGASGVEDTPGVVAGAAIYPNPASSTVTLRYDGGTGPVVVTVVDITGRVLSSETVARLVDHRLDVSGLGEGSYFARIRSAAGIVTLPFTVVR